MTDPRTNADDAYDAFMAMGDQEWKRFLSGGAANIAGLTIPELRGFERAAEDRVRKVREEVE